MENVKDTARDGAAEMIAQSMTDELVRAAISNLGEGEAIPAHLRKAMESDFARFMKNDDEVVAELARIQEEYRALVEQSNEEFKALTESMDVHRVIEKVSQTRDTALKIGNEAAAARYDDIVTDLKSSIDLGVLFSALEKVGNPAKMIPASQSASFSKEFKKFRERLGNNKRYFFPDPNGVVDAIEAALPDERKEYARLVLFSLSRFVVGGGQALIDKHSIFISQFIKNAYQLRNEDFAARQEMIDSIVRYGDEIHNSGVILELVNG